eukprot:CAMPEP_0119361666 /NCGR_PEP_ID=MMETSP1334-20130426/8926_1 /TAXON_ID=127549 /ORGANISM="Calcidiscus leptoporus, Strain RCC1130" /LENGTH=832 /DNA_ID=CAMNT_0007376741 /DNA_START=218 /DNA_END=2716 /DNA_ORIENTATION=+
MAIGLLWSTSLAMCTYFVGGYVTLPPFALVFRACNQTYHEVVAQRESHAKCSARQLRQCDDTLELATQRELRRKEAASVANDAILRTQLGLRDSCVMSRTNALALIQQAQQAHVPIHWCELQCTAKELREAKTAVGDASKRQAAIDDVALEFTQASMRQHDVALAAVDRRREYDRHYVGTKTRTLREFPASVERISDAQRRAILDSLRSLNRSLQVCGGGSCELPLEPQIAAMRQQYQLVRLELELRIAKMDAYQQATEAMVAATAPAIDKAKELVAAISPNEAELPPFAQAILKLPEISLPQIDIGSPISAGHFPSDAALRAQLEAYYQRQQMRTRIYVDQASTASNEWAEQLAEQGDSMPTLLDDYDPPPVNTTEMHGQMKARRNDFLAKHRESVDALVAFFRAAPAANDTAASANFSLTLPQLESRPQAALGLEPLHGTDLTFEVVLGSLSGIAAVATVLDLVWRGYTSVRLVAKYWSLASVGIPPLDARENERHTAGLPNVCEMLGTSQARCVQLFLLSPVTAGIVLGGALVLIAYVLTSSLYLPLYGAYVDGCLKTPVNGTLLTENLFSLAFDFAATEGDKAMLSGLNDYHEKQVNNCSAQFQPSLLAYQAAKRQLAQAAHEHATAARDVRLLHQCLNATRLDSDAAAAGVHLLSSLTQTLADAAECMSPLNTSLAPAVFDCEALPDCQRTCGGPNRELVHSNCRRCGCHVEWFGHGLVLYVLLVLGAFACVNGGRIFAIDGLHLLLSRRLFRDGYEFISNCDAYGNVCVPEATLQERLRNAIARVKCSSLVKGIVYLLLALSLSAPLVFMIEFVGSHLQLSAATVY